MRSLVSEELLPYYDEYKRLLTTIREDQELMGQNEDFIEDYMRDADVDPTEDSTIRIFTDGITNANDSINDCSARLDEIDKTIVESGLVGSIYKSRLAVAKKIAELEKKFPLWKKLEDEKARKIAEYIENEPTSEDIAEIVLKVGDKKFRNACVKLNEREDYYYAVDTRYVLEQMELGATKMLIPADMLVSKVNGKSK